MDKQPIESQKLFVNKNIPRQNGIERRLPMMQTQAMAIGFLPEYRSLMIPPIIEDMKPRALRARAFADANSVFIIGNAA